MILLKKHRSNSLTTSRGHHLIEQLHAGPLPDFLDDSAQLLVGLLKISCTITKESRLERNFKEAFFRPHTTSSYLLF